ncbi:hypothetical protein FFL01_16380 [Flavobacterium flevense]|uniref:Uncharacterized protein n=1 Tax=Flavobacterium flevense TaxID=983 RepID=A0A4Y4AXS1_9FLAO|nr:hypothetical protein [Flavobacterium flevense]GEC72099.1 hypothetical protein FFL01_16380 [Flavobacterium flevense]
MKKLTMLLGLLTVLTIVSCREKKDPPPPPPPQAESVPAESVPEASKEEADGTSVNVGTDGVDIQTKDGKNETKVTVEGGEANIEIKK